MNNATDFRAPLCAQQLHEKSLKCLLYARFSHIYFLGHLLFTSLQETQHHAGKITLVGVEAYR